MPTTRKNFVRIAALKAFKDGAEWLQENIGKQQDTRDRKKTWRQYFDRSKPLRDVLGIELFEASPGRSTKLSKDGDRLLPLVSKMLENWQEICFMAERSQEIFTKLSIGIRRSHWEKFIRPWLEELHEQAPNIKVEILCHTADTIERKLKKGVLDLAVIYPKLDIDHMDRYEIEDQQLVMLVNKQSADNKTPAFKQLVSHREKWNYIYIRRGIDFLDMHSELFSSYHKILNPLIEFNMSDVAFDFLRNTPNTFGYFPKWREKFIKEGIDIVQDAEIINRALYMYQLYHEESEEVEFINNGITILNDKKSMQNLKEKRKVKYTFNEEELWEIICDYKHPERDNIGYPILRQWLIQQASSMLKKQFTIKN